MTRTCKVQVDKVDTKYSTSQENYLPFSFSFSFRFCLCLFRRFASAAIAEALSLSKPPRQIIAACSSFILVVQYNTLAYCNVEPLSHHCKMLSRRSHQGLYCHYHHHRLCFVVTVRWPSSWFTGCWLFPPLSLCDYGGHRRPRFGVVAAVRGRVRGWSQVRNKSGETRGESQSKWKERTRDVNLEGGARRAGWKDRVRRGKGRGVGQEKTMARRGVRSEDE